MSGGGGGGGGGTNWMDVQIKQMEQQEKDANRQREAETAMANELSRVKAFDQQLWGANNSLRDRGYDTLTKRGLDTGTYGGLIDKALESTRSRISPLDANPGQYFTDSIIDDALGKERDSRRIMYGNAVGNRFSPGFEQKYFDAKSDDSYINDVLGTQKHQALAHLGRARDRGQLDNHGYDSAVRRIGEMEVTGRATANRLGDAVLQGNRTRLTDVGNEARAAAGAYELGQNFDPNAYNTRFDEVLGGMQTSLEGDVRGALEGQQFFDIGDLIARGGAAQGAVNPAAESIDALAAREKLRNAGRGTAGSTF